MKIIKILQNICTHKENKSKTAYFSYSKSKVRVHRTFLFDFEASKRKNSSCRTTHVLLNNKRTNVL